MNRLLARILIHVRGQFFWFLPFCLAMHGADLHIRSGAWPAQFGNCSAWRGCAYYLFSAEYLKTAEAIRKVPTSLYRVLEDGSLSKELRTEYLTGAKPPKFTGGVAKPGEEIVLETEDREYLKEGEIKAYLDKQSFTTEINSSSMEILEEERKMVISPKAFKGKAEGEHTLILVRDGYQTLELPLSFKEEAVEKLPEERLSPSNLSS